MNGFFSLFPNSVRTIGEDEQFKTLMESSVGVSYANLKKYLKQQKWREADHETARLIREAIQKVAGSTEVSQINLNIFPLVDLKTIDTLWKENSDGRFGFSIQKDIYQRCKDRDAFGNKVGWRFKNGDGDYVWYGNDNFNYKFTATGYLPSSLWAGEDGWFENRRDRLAMLFARMESIQDVSPVKNDISPVRNDEIFLATQSKKVRSLVQDVNISILLIVPQTLSFVADVDASSTLPRDKVKLNLTNQTKSNNKELNKDFYAE